METKFNYNEMAQDAKNIMQLIKITMSQGDNTHDTIRNRERLLDYLPDGTLGHNILKGMLNERVMSQKQMWAIAFQLQKDSTFVKWYAGFIEEVFNYGE